MARRAPNASAPRRRAPRRTSAKPVALVAGGTGGSGAAVCAELARRGWDVALSYRTRAERAEAVAQTCRSLGARALARRLDVTSDASAESFVRAASASLGPPRALVNLASWAAPGGAYGATLADLDLRAVARAVEVDLVGTLRMIRAAAPAMRGAGGGSIVNFGSASADAADPDLLAYMAAKSSVSLYTRALARELGPSIRVNCVAPGAVATEWLDAWNVPAREVRSLARAAALRRLGEPSDVASLVAFLVSDEASFLTGQTVTLDGGMFNP